MINETLLNFNLVLIYNSSICPHLCIATNGQRSRVCGKLFFSSVVPLVVNGGSIGTLTELPRNARRDFLFLFFVLFLFLFFVLFRFFLCLFVCLFSLFSNTCQKMRGGKHVKVKKRRCQDILHFRADARKLILGFIGTPLDHLSVKKIFIGLSQ